MSKFLLLILLAIAGYLLWKKANPPTLRQPDPGHGPLPDRASPRRAMSDAQQQLYARLQTALPSTMILVRPALPQILDAGDAGDRLASVPIDFAICRKDSSPIGVVVLDDAADGFVEQVVQRAGLRFVRFRSANLPNDQDIKDALGFL